LTSSLLDVRRGSQTPRVSNVPPYDLSAAPEVIELAASAGLHLDPWQQYVLTHGLGMHSDGRWAANRVSTWVPRQNGKGAIIEALELAWLFLFEEEEIVHSAHQHRTSQKAYARLEKLIRRTPDLFRRVKQFRQANGEQQIETHDGRLLQYNTRSRTALRGFSSKKVVLDEAQELNLEQIAAIMPTLSAQYNWQAWFFGTPPDDPTAWCYGLREDGEAGVPRLAHFDWGAVLNLDDPDDLARSLDIDLAYDTNPALAIASRSRLCRTSSGRRGWAPSIRRSGWVCGSRGLRAARASSRRSCGGSRSTCTRLCPPGWSARLRWCSSCRSVPRARTPRSPPSVPVRTGRCWRRSWSTAREPTGWRPGWRS